jgi:hypothetical protein
MHESHEKACHALQSPCFGIISIDTMRTKRRVLEIFAVILVFPRDRGKRHDHEAGCKVIGRLLQHGAKALP